MGWADEYVKGLKRGETVQFRPRGNSMSPTIKSKALVTVDPISADSPVKKRDIVLCQVNNSQYLHFVSSMEKVGDVTRYQISNAAGRVNGWTTKVFGKVIKVEP